MHLYTQIMKRELDYSEGEWSGLCDQLGACPGVMRVKLVERHRKGGYAATMEVDRETLTISSPFFPLAAGRCWWSDAGSYPARGR